jgi:hypothetical protein
MVIASLKRQLGTARLARAQDARAKRGQSLRHLQTVGDGRLLRHALAAAGPNVSVSQTVPDMPVCGAQVVCGHGRLAARDCRQRLLLQCCTEEGAGSGHC